MDITKFSAVSTFADRQPNELAASLSINLSRSELLDRKIAQFQERQDTNQRRDLLRDSLSLKSAARELERFIRLSSKQGDDRADPIATSNSNLGLDTSAGGDLEKAIDQVASLSGISSGNIIVMGEKVSIDITSDSINDVIDRINNSNAGVTASFNTSTNQFEITDDQAFTISNGSSNFFATLDVDTGSIESVDEEPQQRFLKSSKVVEAFDRFTRKFNKFLETTATVSEKLGIANEEDDDGITLPDNPFMTAIKTAIENSIVSQVDEDFDGTGKVRFDYGLTLSFTTGEFIQFDSKEYDLNLEGDVSSLQDLFLTEEDENDSTSGGLIALLTKALDTINTDLEVEINSSSKTGLLVDVEA